MPVEDEVNRWSPRLSVCILPVDRSPKLDILRFSLQIPQIARFSNISLSIEDSGQYAPQCGSRTRRRHCDKDRAFANRCYVADRSCLDDVLGGRGIAHAEMFTRALPHLGSRAGSEAHVETQFLRVAELPS